MTTNFTAKLTHKTYELDLHSGNYKLGLDFVPPPLNLVPQISRTGKLISKDAENRRWRFGIHVLGTSEAEIARSLGSLQQFLSYAGDESNPLYLEFRGNSDVGFEPMWGQYGANYRYEIVSGSASISRLYANATLRAEGLPNCGVALVIKPYALGLALDDIGSATGGIFEDYIGLDEGLSRGLIIPPATTNKFENPVFGHSSVTYGWTPEAGKVGANQTRDFKLFGPEAARVYAYNGTGTFTQSIAAGNTNTHTLSCYIKKPDSSAVTSSDVTLHYGSSYVPTYTSVGNGWYRLTLSVSGIAGATDTGIEIKDGRILYADGFQFEEKSSVTPACYGDMLGCSWSGTAHESTSTRTVARLKVNSDVLFYNHTEGSIRIVWKVPFANTYGSDVCLFEEDTANYKLSFIATGDLFRFTDGTNTINSSAQTFSIGDVLVLHIIFGLGNMKVYRDGSEIATGSSFDMPSSDGWMYIGSDDAVTNHCGGTFMGFDTFDLEMSVTEVLNDYTNILELIEDDRRLSSIPYLWTKDGDDKIDNCDDSTNDNYAVLGGIPGSHKAKTEIKSQTSTAFIKNGFWYARSSMPYEKFVYPTSQWYSDAQGTVLATCSGGEYDQDTVGSATVVNTLAPEWPEEFRGKIHFFGRLAAAASDSAKVSPVFYLGSGGTAIVGNEKTISLTTTFAWYYLGSIYIEYPNFVDSSDKVSVWGLQVDDVDGSVDFRNDFLMAINGDVLYSSGSISTGAFYLFTAEETTYRINSATGELLTRYPTKGSGIELEPDRYNFLWAFLADDAEAHTIADTLTFNSIKITPRWSLL